MNQNLPTTELDSGPFWKKFHENHNYQISDRLCFQIATPSPEPLYGIRLEKHWIYARRFMTCPGVRSGSVLMNNWQLSVQQFSSSMSVIVSKVKAEANKTWPWRRRMSC